MSSLSTMESLRRCASPSNSSNSTMPHAAEAWILSGGSWKKKKTSNAHREAMGEASSHGTEQREASHATEGDGEDTHVPSSVGSTSFQGRRGMFARRERQAPQGSPTLVATTITTRPRRLSSASLSASKTGTIASPSRRPHFVDNPSPPPLSPPSRTTDSQGDDSLTSSSRSSVAIEEASAARTSICRTRMDRLQSRMRKYSPSPLPITKETVDTTGPSDEETKEEEKIESMIPLSHQKAIQEAFGTDCDLYRDVLHVGRRFNTRQIRIAFFRRGRQVLRGASDRLDEISPTEGEGVQTVLANIQSIAWSRFQAVGMAYEILSKPQWRQEYDKRGWSIAPEGDDDEADSSSGRKETPSVEESAPTTTETDTPPLETPFQDNVAAKEEGTTRAMEPILRATVASSDERRTRSTAGQRIRWAEEVEELVFCQDPDEHRIKPRKPRSGRSSPEFGDEEMDAETRAYIHGKDKQSHESFIVHSININETIDRLERGSLDNSLVTAFLDDLDSSLNELEDGFDDLIGFMTRSSSSRRRARFAELNLDEIDDEEVVETSVSAPHASTENEAPKADGPKEFDTTWEVPVSTESKAQDQQQEEEDVDTAWGLRTAEAVGPAWDLPSSDAANNKSEGAKEAEETDATFQLFRELTKPALVKLDKTRVSPRQSPRDIMKVVGTKERKMRKGHSSPPAPTKIDFTEERSGGVTVEKGGSELQGESTFDPFADLSHLDRALFELSLPTQSTFPPSSPDAKECTGVKRTRGTRQVQPAAELQPPPTPPRQTARRDIGGGPSKKAFPRASDPLLRGSTIRIHRTHTGVSSLTSPPSVYTTDTEHLRSEGTIAYFCSPKPSFSLDKRQSRDDDELGSRQDRVVPDKMNGEDFFSDVVKFVGGLGDTISSSTQQLIRDNTLEGILEALKPKTPEMERCYPL